MPMKSTRVPTPEEEVQALGPLIPLLFEGFEGSTEAACHFFESQNKPVNPWLYPELVRYHMTDFLRDKVQVIEDFDPEEIIKNGLSLIFRRRRIRMWKAHDDELPAAGPSKTKLGFLNQQLSFYLEDGAFQEIEHNLVVLWSVDRAQRLSKLYLLCPKSAESRWASGQAHWSRQLDNELLSDEEGTIRPAVPSDYPPDLPLEKANTELGDVDSIQRAE